MIKSMDPREVKWGSVKTGGSIGMLPKTILEVEGNRYYVKVSSYNIVHGVYGIESVSEVIASRLAVILRVDCVYNELYDALISKDGRTFRTYLCISRDYTNGSDVIPFEDSYIKIE